MKVTEFSQLVCALETGKKEVNIAQVKEILSVVNELLDGELYKIVRTLKK